MDSPRGGFRALAESWRKQGYGVMDLSAAPAIVAEESPVLETPAPDLVAEPEAESPPPAIGQDERRMQVRAYNLWADLLADRSFPDIRAFDPRKHGDFGEYAVLLDFSSGIEDPMILHLGSRLANECGVGSDVPGQLSDVPPGSLISRITDHYIQILARQTPIGFEAEFVNRQGKMIVYRGILLPFSSDDRNIDHIYGVLNWKEVASDPLVDELSADLSHALMTGGVEAEKRVDPLPAPLSRRLRALTPTGFDALDEHGPEFTLLLARRMSSGNVMLLSEVPFDPALMRHAANKLDDR